MNNVRCEAPRLFILLGVICIPVLAGAQKKSHSASRPTFFEPEDQNRGLTNAIAPSDLVLDALLKRIEADNMGDEIEKLTRERKRTLFEAVRVNLGLPSDEDYIVHGKGPMIGADCEWFWVVRVKNKKAEVVLFANGLALQLERRKASAYRDIGVSWATAAFIGRNIYRYDGSAYKLLREQSKEQKP